MEGEQFSYSLDKRTGLFARMACDGREQIVKPMEVNLWRAPTDNDMYVKQEWYRAGYDRTSVRAYRTFVEQEKHTVRIHCMMSLSADTVQRILDMDTIWTIDGAGAVSLSMKVKRHPEFPVLPRFGIRLYLDPVFEHVNYYGMGPMESYIDKHRAASHGIYSAAE